jgi:hypothetical protein
VDPDPHREFQLVLCFDRRSDGIGGRGEHRAHAVTGVLEHDAVVPPDGCPNGLVVGGESGGHGGLVGLPSFGRPLDVAEPERHRARRQPDISFSHAAETTSSGRAPIGRELDQRAIAGTGQPDGQPC